MAKTNKQKANQEEIQDAPKTQKEKAVVAKEKQLAKGEASEAGGALEEDLKHLEEDEEPTEEARDALHRLRSEIDEVKQAELEQVLMSGGRASAYAQRVEPLYQEALPQLRAHYKILPEKQLGLLRSAALAFWRARRDVGLIDPTSGTLRKHYEEAGELKEAVSDLLKVVGRGDPQVQRLLNKIRPGTGYEDRANDLNDLYPTVKHYQEILLKKALLTEAQIESIPKLAESLLAPSKEKAALQKARLLRDRAWTYFLKIQKEMARYLRFIYHDEPTILAQIDLYAPTTASKSKATRKSKAATPETPNPPETPTVPTADPS